MFATVLRYTAIRFINTNWPSCPNAEAAVDEGIWLLLREHYGHLADWELVFAEFEDRAQ